jgi:hypothetical protein
MADVSFLSPQKNQCILTTHTEALSRAARQTGVVNGNRVTPTDPASMTVIIEAGRIRIAGAPSDVTQADVALNVAHESLPRMDIIYRDTSGVPQVATGIPDAIVDPKALGDWKSYTAPTPPSTIPDGVILAAVYVPPAAASISSGYIWMFAAGVGDISTSVAIPGSDSYPPSEQAVRELVETKVSISDIVTTVDNPGSDAKVPSEQAVRELAGTLAPAAKGVTNGDSHDHSGGDGAQVDHTTLSNAGTNSHSAVDSHLASTLNPHTTTAAQVGADVTTASIHAASSKASPADDDELGLVDSAASWILKKLTWSNLKATLKTYFDTYYILKTVLTAQGDIMIRDGSGPSRLGKGTEGQFLRQGPNDPAWSTGTFDVAFPFGDGLAVITENQEWGFRMPVACKVVSARIREISQTSGSVTCSLYRHALSGDKGSAIDSFALSGSTYYEETGLALTFSAGQWATVAVTGITSAKKIVCTLTFEAT